MSKPIISVLMPSYNHSDYVAISIESIVAQGYSNWELLIVDDASTDTSCNVINGYTNDERIRVIQHTANQGISATLNDAMEEAKGEYIAFTASDDVSLPNRFACELDYFENHPDAGIVFSPPEIIDSLGKEHEVDLFKNVFWKDCKDSKAIAQRLVFYQNCLFASSAMGRREVLEQVGWFNCSLHQLQDYEYWLRALQCTQVHILAEPVAQYRFDQNGKNASYPNASAKQRSLLELTAILDTLIEAPAGFLADILELPAGIDTLSLQYHYARKLAEHKKCYAHLVSAYRLLYKLLIEHEKELEQRFNFGHDDLIKIGGDIG